MPAPFIQLLAVRRKMSVYSVPMMGSFLCPQWVWLIGILHLALLIFLVQNYRNFLAVSCKLLRNILLSWWFYRIWDNYLSARSHALDVQYTSSAASQSINHSFIQSILETFFSQFSLRLMSIWAVIAQETSSLPPMVSSLVCSQNGYLESLNCFTGLIQITVLSF